MTEAASTVHVLIDRIGKWHASPIDDDTFQQVTDRHPHMPLRYSWVHIPKDRLGSGAQSRAIAAHYPGWVRKPAGEIVADIVRREVEHAEYHLREGERDAMGFPITEEGRAELFGSRAPEPWALEEARKSLAASRRDRFLAHAKAVRWEDDRLGGKPRKGGAR